MVAEPPPRLFTTDEYEAMIHAGILREGEHVELIAGRILMTRYERAGSIDAEPPERLFTVDEYDCMIKAGIVREGEHVELIAGRILEMAAMGGLHIGTVLRANRVLRLALPLTVDILVQSAIRLPPNWQPEPDLAIVRHRADDYTSGAAGPEDILLVMEVADSTVGFDRNQKIPEYAAAGLPEAWLADLPGDRLWVYRSPRDGQYEQVTVVRRGETLSPLAFPELVLAVDDLLPPLDQPGS